MKGKGGGGGYYQKKAHGRSNLRLCLDMARKINCSELVGELSRVTPSKDAREKQFSQQPIFQ